MADIFLQIHEIEGEALEEGHEGQIELIEWTWKLDNPASYNMNSSEASSKVDVQSIIVTKICDKATINLTRYCALGKYIPSATITCCKNSGGGRIDYLIIKLDHVLVRGVDWQGFVSDEIIKEVVTLSFGQFRIEYKMQYQSGAAPGSLHFGYSIKTHQEVE